MSFIEELFNDNKKMGRVFILGALLSILLAILGIIVAVFVDVSIVRVIVAAIGTIISAYLMYQFGIELRDNSTEKVPVPAITNIIGAFIDHSNPLTRVSIFAGIVKLIGINLIISGIFTAVALAAAGQGASGIATAVFSIIIGLIFLWGSREISKGGDHGFMWLLLMILFVIAVLISIISFFTGLLALDIASAALALIMFLLSGYALYLCNSREVRAQLKA